MSPFAAGWDLFLRGGPVMVPLLALSLVSLGLILERSVFWSRLHSGSAKARWRAVSASLRAGDLEAAAKKAANAPGPYAWFAREMLRRLRGDVVFADASAREVIEQVRPAIERFSTTLSTIITAAPLLGILGTVVGIIDSFGLLGGSRLAGDPTLIAGGIAQALYTTAFGLIIALVTLFPYMIFRAQADRAFSRLETFAAIAVEMKASRSQIAPAS